MKNMKKTAAAGIALAATAGLVAGPMMMAGQAWAADGTITINKVAGNQTVTYQPVQIFTAIVEDVDGDNQLKDIHWASTAVETAVKGVCTTAGYDGDDEPQLYAKFIAEKFGTTDLTTILGDSDFGMKLANAVKGLGDTEATFAAGTTESLAEGYWVIVPSTLPAMADPNNAAMGSSPIFAVINDESPVSVDEKTKLPTLVKEIKEGDAWGAEADHRVTDNTVSYRLIGELPTNVKSFESYTYTFTDELGEGMSYNKDSFVVKLDNTELSPTIAYSNNDQKVTIALGDLIKEHEADITATSKVTVEYTATRTAFADGEVENTAKLEYSNNPTGEGTGFTVPKTAKDYSYSLELNKKGDNYDAIDWAAYSEAAFAIKDDATGQYIKVTDGVVSGLWAAGTAAKDAAISTVQGAIAIKGLDAGTYTIEETKTPGDAGVYKPLEPAFQIQIAKGGAVTEAVDHDHVQITDGVVEIKNDKYIVSGLPFTGGDTFYLALGAGAILLIVAGAGFVINRRKNDQED